MKCCIKHYMLAGIKVRGSSTVQSFFSMCFWHLLIDNQAAGSTPSKGGPAATRPKGSVIDLTEDDDDVQGKFKWTIFKISFWIFISQLNSKLWARRYKSCPIWSSFHLFALVTGVKKATVTTPSPAQRTHPVINISNSKTTIYCEGEKEVFSVNGLCG